MKKTNVILTLLVILSVITFLDRTCITFASMEIKQDLGIDQSGFSGIETSVSKKLALYSEFIG